MHVMGKYKNKSAQLTQTITLMLDKNARNLH